MVSLRSEATLGCPGRRSGVVLEGATSASSYLEPISQMDTLGLLLKHSSLVYWSLYTWGFCIKPNPRDSLIEVVACRVRFLSFCMWSLVALGRCRKERNVHSGTAQHSHLQCWHCSLGCNCRKWNFFGICSNVYFHFFSFTVADLGHRHPPSALNCLFPCSADQQHPCQRTICSFKCLQRNISSGWRRGNKRMI